MNFLAIESVTKSPGAAIFIKEKLIDENHSNNCNSSILASLINGLLVKNSVAATELDFISVTVGPGTFTGLRVGISLAQGLSYSINKPIVPVNVLDAITSQAEYGDKIPVAFHSHADFFYYRNPNIDDSIRLITIDEIEGQAIYGCNLDQYSDLIDYKKINFTAVDVGKYSLVHYNLLKQDDIGSISPIYLNEFRKFKE